ncbi:hypothetical protein C8Q70DRAFT_481887 [Cubamyces menziesii]|nr:hypothetical protein C8Q70DRAFT_481887 [Cubamyces menziesii]
MRRPSSAMPYNPSNVYLEPTTTCRSLHNTPRYLSSLLRVYELRSILPYAFYARRLSSFRHKSAMTRLRLRQTLALMQAIVQHLHQGYASHGFTLPPQCTVASYSWLSNSAGQTACDVVNAVVSPGCLTVTRGSRDPLPSSSCACNTVLYSLIYACGLCADSPKLLVTFSTYSGIMDCDDTLAGQYPGDIPLNVSVPPWAFLELTSQGTLDIAQADHQQMEWRRSASASTLTTTSGVAGTQPSNATTSIPGDSPLSDLSTVHSETGGTSTQSPLSTPSSSTAGSITAGHDTSKLSRPETLMSTSQSDLNSTRSPTRSNSAARTASHIAGTAASMSTATGSKATPSPTTSHHKTAPSTSLATIIGSAIAGVSVSILVMCGIALAIRRGRRREVGADVLVNEGLAGATSGVEHVHLLGPKPVSPRIEQEQRCSVASQPPRASQECSRVAQSPKTQMGGLHYASDTPTTHPPSYSAGLDGPVVLDGRTDDPPAYSP